MAYNLKIPTTHTYYFKVEADLEFENLVETQKDENHDLFLTFRQSSAADSEKRNQMLSRREYRNTGDGTGQLLMIDETNVDAVNRYEIYLTLADCDIKFPDGTGLEFETINGQRHLSDRKQFDEWWGIMYPHWGPVVSKCCLRTNANWDPKRPSPK